MKVFKERWVDGKLVIGEEAAAPAPLPSKAEAFVRTMYGARPDEAEPLRGYHTVHIDNSPAKRGHLFERADARNAVDLLPGAQ